MIKPDASYVESVDANWTLTYLGLFARFNGIQKQKFTLYGKFGMGMVKVSNSFDVNVEEGAPVKTMSGEFDLGNRFQIGVGLGLEYLVSPKVSLVTEICFRHIFSTGASASTSLVITQISGEQRFDIQSLSIRAGLRIPLSGI